MQRAHALVLAALLLFLAFVSAPARAADSPQKFALLIGNAQYDYAPLQNPENDATDLARLLEGLGFQVTLVRNGPRQAMLDAVKRHAARIGPQALSLFFFAGHGVQMGGRNFLLPVGPAPTRADELPNKAVALETVIEALGAAKPRFNLVLLDACRNNPFTDNQLPGLAPLDAPPNTLVAFATSPGKVASDGAGRNGLYTQHVLRHLASAELRIEEVFKRVRIGVLEDSSGQQLPWENTALTAELALAVYPKGPPAPRPEGAEPPWIAQASEAELRHYLTENRDPAARRPVLRRLVQRRAEGGVRQAALALAEVPCPGCPRVTPLDLPGEPQPLAAGTDLVTAAEYRRCVQARACTAPPDMALTPDDEPAQGLAALDARRYIDWLNTLPSRWRFFLPTREQWQRAFRASYVGGDGQPVYARVSACRVGNLYDQNGALAHRFPWTALPCTDGFQEAAPVGMFLPSQNGLFDLVGNVWQWTASCAAPDGSCRQQHLAGGSWATGRSWTWEQPPALVADADLQAPLFGLRVFASRR